MALIMTDSCVMVLDKHIPTLINRLYFIPTIANMFSMNTIVYYIVYMYYRLLWIWNICFIIWTKYWRHASWMGTLTLCIQVIFFADSIEPVFLLHVTFFVMCLQDFVDSLWI